MNEIAEDIFVVLDGQRYRWSNGLWTNVRTNMVPTVVVENDLNRQLLDQNGAAWLSDWGQNDLLRFYNLLRSLGAGEKDFIKLGIGYLIEPEEAENIKPRSPLHAMGYRVGKTGLSEQGV